jgi:hypothetical protein
MRTPTPALAIAYMQWCRHRRHLIVAMIIFLLTAAAGSIAGSQFEAKHLGTLVGLSVTPLLLVFGFTMNSFLLVDEAGSFSSGHLKSMFNLPVHNWTLVIWPMVYGSVVSGVLWVATALLVYWPMGLRPPLIWPALGFAALMAWLQAVSWMPWAKGALRELMCLAIVAPLMALPLWLLLWFEGSHRLIGLLFVAYMPVAFAAGYAAVASDRHGEAWPLWPSLSRTLARGARATPLRPWPPFKSTARAQFWYEWTCHGWSYPLYVGFVFAAIMGVLVWRGTLEGTLLFGWVFALMMSLPIILAGASGAMLGRTKPLGVKDSSSISFLATRPVSSYGLVAAKYQMVYLSGLLTWLIVVLGTTCWVIISGNLGYARVLARDILTQYAGWRGLAVIAATIIVAPAITWRQLSGSFPFMLAGRRPIVEGCFFASAMVFMGFVSGATWLYTHPEALPRVLAATPWLVSGLAVIKAALAIGAFYTAVRSGLISWRNVGVVVGIWVSLSAVAMLLAGLVLKADAVPVSVPLLYVGIALLMPLCRFPLAALAVDWNRHR